MKKQIFYRMLNAKIEATVQENCQLNDKIDADLEETVRSSLFGAFMRTVNSNEFKRKK